METKLARIAEIAKTKPNERFTSLIHLINGEMLTQCHKEMKGSKAAGVDEVTKAAYEMNLKENIDKLIERMKRQAYQPQPARRVYIPKPGTQEKRPLGIPAYEDKLVQAALGKILNAIYEQDFLECSFGFRPGRGCHDALKVLNRIVNKPNIQYVVDTDIRRFFDHMDHDWMKAFIEHRIEDKNLRRLMARLLKAGIVEEGIQYDTPQGTPQGGCCSPIMANIYLHYVIDLWFEKVVRKHSKGQAYMVRYADDGIFCFENREDALRFYEALKRRLAKFKLEIAEEKTNIVELRKGKDEEDDSGTFDFLGFTHYMGKSSNGRKQVMRKTSKKKYKASLSRCKEWLKRNRILPAKELMKKLNNKIQGHCNYYGVSGNRRAVGNFINEVRSLLFKWMNRRSQKKSFNWETYVRFLRAYPLPKAKVKVNLYTPGAGASYLL